MAIDPAIPIDPGDIFWVTLPSGLGSAQSGRRPCIAMSRRTANSQRTIVVVPMTSNLARANAFNIKLPTNEIIRAVNSTSAIVDSVALCGQVFTVDKQFLESKFAKLSQNAVLAVQLGLGFLFDIR
jgi:mRNA-degrading endonuclease toxin of MazEF toxin-antitoxin module